MWCVGSGSRECSTRFDHVDSGDSAGWALQLPGDGRHKRRWHVCVGTCGRHAVPGASPPAAPPFPPVERGGSRLFGRSRRGGCGTACVEGGLLTDGLRAGPVGPRPATATVVAHRNMLCEWTDTTSKQHDAGGEEVVGAALVCRGGSGRPRASQQPDNGERGTPHPHERPRARCDAMRPVR